MDFFRLNTKNGGTENPCQIVSEYLLHEEQGGTLASFISQYDFDSREAIERAIRTFIRVLALDSYMRKPHLAEFNAFAAAVHKRYDRIFTDESKLAKLPVTMSGEIWHGGYSRRRLEDNTQRLLGNAEPDGQRFAACCEKIQRVYGLSPVEVEKIHFFVEQVKAGANFPNSLRRMLYIWGATKMTGKTTTATMLVCLLNGDMDESHISAYSSNLSTEMQIKSFAVPKISECNVCLMDECFYADMGKTYADFKRFITSSNGRARLPFGQEFDWTGYPNYIATSNDSLRKFIKDWNDRRYLSVEFKQKPAVQMSFEDIKQMWLDFILNSTRTMGWKEWNDLLAPETEEIGDKQEMADDLEIELRKTDMLTKITNLFTPSNSPACAQNKVPLKWFVDAFAQTMGTVEAHKRRGEIEAAVLNVFGARYSTTGYWLLSGLKDTAQRLLNEINNAHYEEEALLDDCDDIQTPF